MHQQQGSVDQDPAAVIGRLSDIVIPMNVVFAEVPLEI
jgi:hypothetical protein